MDRKMEPNGRKRVIGLLIFAAFGLACVIAVLFYMRHKKTHISTEDAFIEGRVHTVSSRVPGAVSQVHVADNQLVKKGDLLVEIDAADYEVRQKEAESGLGTEQARLGGVNARIEAERRKLEEAGHKLGTARANLELQVADLRQADLDLKRAENLFGKDAISRESLEKTKTGHDVAIARAKAAKDQVRLADSAMETQRAVIREVEAGIRLQEFSVRKNEASLKSAALNVGYTRIFAPADGYVTKKSVQQGNQIQAGQPLLAVVPLDDIWITANYKETQLEKIRPGQKVKIKTGMYPGRSFSGSVDSIMSGTGSAFSLFPPENATGNFVKVVQRIPVKILLDKNTDSGHVLRLGMSVEPTVIVE